MLNRIRYAVSILSYPTLYSKVYGVCSCAAAAPKIPPGDLTMMSSRGSETTEAISRRVDCIEIAALTSFARNNKEDSWHSL